MRMSPHAEMDMETVWLGHGSVTHWLLFFHLRWFLELESGALWRTSYVDLEEIFSDGAAEATEEAKDALSELMIREYDARLFRMGRPISQEEAAEAQVRELRERQAHALDQDGASSW
jgi:hypothetical protein